MTITLAECESCTQSTDCLDNKRLLLTGYGTEIGMTRRDAVIATRRFGLGAKPGDVARISADPMGYLLRSLANPRLALLESDQFLPSNVALSSLRSMRRARRRARRGRRGGGGANDRVMSSGRAASGQADMSKRDQMMAGSERAFKMQRRGLRRKTVMLEQAARLERAISTEHPFIERLVQFWSNHFCVSMRKGGMVRYSAGAYEREAIRPFVLGRFSDMLRAVVQHPTMLIYLDNHRSTGPNSRAGRRRRRGLNENLAREILELHTLGVDGGYVQNDVRNLARIITGWSVTGQRHRRLPPGIFYFARQRHEPGDWRVLGKLYREDGVRTGERVLNDLARHPATARHIAKKLARHFVGDNAPSSLINRLTKVFRRTDGNLAALARTLAKSKEAWAAEAIKILPPYDFIVGMARGLGLRDRPRVMLRLIRRLGQPLWQPPSPKGWPDEDGAWLNPAGLRERLRIAERVANRAARRHDPRRLGDDLLGPMLTTPEREAIARAETRAQGVKLLIMSPAFQRR